MNIHEYQAKELFGQFGIVVPSGFVAESVDKVAETAGKLGPAPWVAKAQVHAGGRGAAGG